MSDGKRYWDDLEDEYFHFCKLMKEKSIFHQHSFEWVDHLKQMREKYDHENREKSK